MTNLSDMKPIQSFEPPDIFLESNDKSINNFSIAKSNQIKFESINTKSNMSQINKINSKNMDIQDCYSKRSSITKPFKSDANLNKDYKSYVIGDSMGSYNYSSKINSNRTSNITGFQISLNPNDRSSHLTINNKIKSKIDNKNELDRRYSTNLNTKPNIKFGFPYNPLTTNSLTKKSPIIKNITNPLNLNLAAKEDYDFQKSKTIFII